MLSVDPVDDCTFWYTQEYYTALSNKDWTTRVGSFRFPGCVDCRLVGGSSLTVEKAAPKLRLKLDRGRQRHAVLTWSRAAS